MPIVLDGTTGITAAAIDAALDASDLTGNVAAARITTALNATGTAPIYACRAWVNFNGTGTVAIRASGNVSSVTDNGTGDYTVNFTTAMPDANYAISGICRPDTNALQHGAIVHIGKYNTAGGTELTTTSAQISTTRTGTTSFSDSPIIGVSIFR